MSAETTAKSSRSASQFPGRVTPFAWLHARALAPWAVVLLAPALGIVVLRAPLVNMLTYADPWFYSGYGWALSHNVAIFGWPYYVDRFTVVLPIAVSTGLLGPVPAYFVLHYVLMAGCGALLYLAVRRFASVPVAAAAVCLLMLNPFFVRLMLWDYTTFVTLPCTIAGVALWYLGATRAGSLWTAFGAGVCLSAAIYANPQSALFLPALIGVEAIAAVRGGRREVITLVVRGCVAVVAGLLVLVVGYLGYRSYIGSFPLKSMFEATVRFIRSSSEYSSQYIVSPSIFLRADPHIYAPVLVCVGVVIVLGRSLFSNTIRARMAQFAVAYTLVYWIFRFAVLSSVVETWFAYYMTAVTGAFALPAILDELGQRRGRARWLLIAGVAVAVTGLIDLVIRSLPLSALSTFNTHTVELACLLLTGCIAAVVATLVRHDSLRLVAIAVFCAIVAAVALTPDRTAGLTGEFSTFGTTAELEGYKAGYGMAQLIAKYDRPSSRVILWDDLEGLGDAGWVEVLGHIGGQTSPPIPGLTSSELVWLRDPTTTRVLAVSESVAQIAGALPALEKQGLGPSLETEGLWGGGRLYYALIKLHAS